MNKDTIICCSFSATPGNRGCSYFNARFEGRGLNWAYKSFKVDDIGRALDAMRTLAFRGAGISMPFKVGCLEYVDDLSFEVTKIGAANTIVNDEGKLTAYNTDYLAAYDMIRDRNLGRYPMPVIFGNGGLSKSVQYAFDEEEMPFRVMTRSDFNELSTLRDTCVFNCTPVEDLKTILDSSIEFIDCLTGTPTGDEFAERQSAEQFELYTEILKWQ